MKLKVGLILLGLLVLSFSLAFQNALIPDLVVNYKDFSRITSIAVGFKYVYFGTEGGIIRYDITQDRWAEPLTGIEGLEGDKIYEIRASHDDERIWARTEFGVFEYTNIFDRWDRIDEMPDNNIQNGRHLSPTFDYFAPPGYVYFNTGVLGDDNNNRYPLTDMVDDGWSTIWIGTLGLGALRADNTGHHMELLKYGLLQEDITTLYSDDGVLWIGGIDNGEIRTGLTVFDWRNDSFDYVETGAPLYAYAADINDINSNDRDILVATDDGLLVIDKETNRVRDHLYRKAGLPDNRTLSILALGDTLYVGTEYGLGILSLDSKSIDMTLKTMLPSLSISCLELVDDNIWIGSDYGAYRMNPGTGKIGRLTTPELTDLAEIRDIKFENDIVWLLTEYNLASINITTAEIETFPEIIRYGDLRAVDVRDTLVAVATQEGLLVLSAGEKPERRLYTAYDGIISDDVRDVLFDGEYIWLATDLGLSRFWYKNPNLYY